MSDPKVAIVYKISSPRGSFVGSTTLSLDKKIKRLRYDARRYAEGKSDKWSEAFDIITDPECTVTVMHALSTDHCKSIDVRLLEREVYDSCHDIRGRRPYRTADEKRADALIYHDINKERIVQRKKAYYDNVIGIPEVCECGSTCIAQKMARHRLSKKHQEFLNTKNVICQESCA